MTRIGLFDSGIGGLTVLKELLQLLPDASYFYFGDTARVPYGSKSPETLLRYSFENSTFIMQQDVDLLVIPCNTVCAIALPMLQKCYSIPIIGVIDAACEAAVAHTRTGRIGVIGTKTTVASGSYQKELQRLKPNIEIFAQACPLFVPYVEEQLFDRTLLQPVIHHYIDPLVDKGIDTLVLGCTHYPILTPFIQSELPSGITIVDPAKTCAEKVVAVVTAQNHTSRAPQTLQFFVSDDPHAFKTFGETFLNIPMDNVQKIMHG